MADLTLHRLSRTERALVYALVGCTTEIFFTALDAARSSKTRDATLRGHTYLWMFPIYASVAVMFEPLHDLSRRQPWWRRAAQYAAGIELVEFASGIAIQRWTGSVPWDYTGASPWQIKGAVRLDYLPVWAMAGLALERCHDELLSLRVARTPRG